MTIYQATTYQILREDGSTHNFTMEWLRWTSTRPIYPSDCPALTEHGNLSLDFSDSLDFADSTLGEPIVEVLRDLDRRLDANFPKPFVTVYTYGP